jgi:hypothetical protein
MVEGKMKVILLFCINFPDSLPIAYTIFKKVTYLGMTSGNNTYYHQDGGIPKSEI